MVKQSHACLCICFLLIITISATAQFRIVGYLKAWRNFPDSAVLVDYSKLTHLNIAFANPDSNGVLNVIPGLSTVVNNAHQKNVKVLMSLGGGNLFGTIGNWQHFTKPDSVQFFCEQILNYLDTNNLDGADVDLEGNMVRRPGSRFNFKIF